MEFYFTFSLFLVLTLCQVKGTTGDKQVESDGTGKESKKSFEEENIDTVGIETTSLGNKTASDVKETSLGDNTASDGVETTSLGDETASDEVETTSLGDKTAFDEVETTSLGNKTASDGVETTSLIVNTASEEVETTSLGVKTVSDGVETTTLSVKTASEEVELTSEVGKRTLAISVVGEANLVERGETEVPMIANEETIRLVDSQNQNVSDHQETNQIQDEPQISKEQYKPDHVPYIALVKKTNGNVCTASILDYEWLITTGQCIWGVQKHEITVHFGATDSNHTFRFRLKVRELFVNPYYTYGILENDIGLIRLKRPVLLSAVVETVATDYNSWNDFEPRQCIAAGYNQHVPLAVHTKAAKGKKKCLCLNENKFVCSDEATSINSKCLQDTGGPLVCDNKLVGVRIGIYNKSKCQNMEGYRSNIKTREKENGWLDDKWDDDLKKVESEFHGKVKRNVANDTKEILPAMMKEIEGQANKGEKETGKNVEEYRENSTTDQLLAAQYDRTIETRNACGDPNSLMIYTYVNDYSDWIDLVLRGDFPSDFIPEKLPHPLPREIYQVLPRSKAKQLENILMYLPVITLTALLM